LIISALPARAEDKSAQQQSDKAQGVVNWDMVSDTVSTTFDKANAILAGNLEVTMPKKVEKKDDYTINAMGQRVPKATAVKAAGSLHNDEPL
jgi:hypothetical protein